MNNYINIEPIVIGFDDVTVNAIQWLVNLTRNASEANAICSLVYVSDDGNISRPYHQFIVTIPKSILDVWLEDSVIDDYIVSTNPKFIIPTKP